MTAAALVIFIVGIIYVMIWCIRNDGVRSISEQTGFIRMRVPPQSDDAEDAAPAPGKPKTPGRAAAAKNAKATGPKAPPPRPGAGGKAARPAGRRPTPGPHS